MAEKKIKCDTCGSRLINIITGAVCWNGCGKLHPMVSEEDHKLGVREGHLNGIPKASMLSVRAETSEQFIGRKVFCVLGKDGIWRRVPKTSNTLNQSAMTASTLIAYFVTEDAIVWLRRDEIIEGQIEGCYKALTREPKQPDHEPPVESSGVESTGGGLSDGGMGEGEKI